MRSPFHVPVMFWAYLVYAFPWDLGIILLLAGGSATFVFGMRRFRGGRGALFLGASLLGALLVVTVAYGSFVEPWIIVVTEREVTLPFAQDLRIVVLSDIHVGPYKGRRFVQRVVEKVNALEPDLVLLAGDFVFHGGNPAEHLAPLKDLSTRYGTFAVLGNHEYSCYELALPYVWKKGADIDVSLPVRRVLERGGVTVLRNEWREVKTDSGSLIVAGIDDVCTRRDKIADLFPPVGKDTPVILLAHNPDVILETEARRPPLIVSGHTHGGQIRLPFIGPLSSLPTELGRSYDQGLFPVDKNTTLAITRGIGESGPRARLFAWPEILLLKATPST